MPTTPVTPYVPQYITVHLGAPSAAAENVTVSFPEYVKNVASSEIYPTWEPAAIRANILAIISFALNRVYTEYYPSRGYPFNITASTAYDQKFIKGRNIFENISQMVDEIFNSYIRRTGFVEPLAAKFCNGTTTTCDGLSQWGSQAMAEQGADSVTILRNYYGDNIEIVNNAPVMGIRSSYPGTPVRLGDRGEPVVRIQTMLNRISRDYPAIPKVQPVDGIFGASTEQSVIKFQQIFSLTPDGVVGNATWYKLVFLYVGVLELAELVSEGQTFYTTLVPVNRPDTISLGDTGENVKVIQYLLSVVAEFYNNIPPVAVDGIFGQSTQKRSPGSSTDGWSVPRRRCRRGHLGRTLPILCRHSGYHEPIYQCHPRAVPAGASRERSHQPDPVPRPTHDTGQHRRERRRRHMIRSQLHLIGQPVRSLQTMLRTISFAYPFLPRLTPDGIFGERTLEAVMLFQREFFPPVTGQVNQATWDAIVSLYHQVVSRLTPLPTRSFPSPEFSVAPGEASVHLNLVQSMFCGLSRVLNGVETCDVSGVNNAATEHNIKWIQHLNHRPETGTLDQESWNTLSRLYTMFVTSAQSPWTTRPELFMP